METKEKKPSGQVLAQFKQFMWNPRTREFMGRTGSSWALIIIFYIIFYAFLTAMFSLTMWVMLQTIDEYTPKYTDRLASPGLMIRPKTDSLDIVYNMSDSSSWNASVSALNEFLSNYNDSIQADNNVPCNFTSYNIQEDSGDVRNHPKTACQFNRSSLVDCSGDDDPTYGYSNGTPCVLIKMNRVINFQPVPLFSNQTYVTVSCSASVKSGETLLTTYFPSSSSTDASNHGIISLKYFPYYGKKAQTNYTQPIVAVQFSNITHNVEYTVKCAIYAKNIQFETRDSFAGRVNFRLRVNQ